MRIGPGYKRILSVAAGAGLLLAGLAGLAGPAGAAVSPGPGVPTPPGGGSLNDVACTPSGQCWAVGYYQTDDVAAYAKGEIFKWTGSQWAKVTIPEPLRQNSLSSISCPAASGCLAVGMIKNHNVSRPEVLRWTGGAWKPIATPAASLQSLSSISCLSMSDCEATGENGVVHWNGTSWGPVTVFDNDALSSVTCLSDTNCWAVGFQVKPNQITFHNAVLHGSGSKWTQEKVPQPSSYGQLSGVTCVSASDCWAVGNEVPKGSNTSVNEVLHWNGSTWSLSSAPAGSQPNNELWAVSCPASSDCWAVGDNNATTEALHWNGTAWSIASVPDPHGSGYLLGVSCQSKTACFATGFSNIPPTDNLVLKWNGTSWSST